MKLNVPKTYLLIVLHIGHIGQLGPLLGIGLLKGQPMSWAGKSVHFSLFVEAFSRDFINT